MRKLFFICCVVLGAFSARGQVVKAEHFNAYTPYAAELFELCKTKFKLPVIFNYRELAGFSSGGLWLGNIVLEFVNHNGSDNNKTLFKGIALEPIQHADTIVKILDAYGVAHGLPESTRVSVDNTEKLLWTNILIKDISADNIRVFVCDYADRVYINTPKKAARKIFNETGGGPLGIVGLKKIVIGSANISKALHGWISLPGVKRISENHFGFFDGPEIVVEKADKDGIKEIQVQVSSLEKATKFLSENKMLAVENNTTLIDPEKLYGLRIVLQQ